MKNFLTLAVLLSCQLLVAQELAPIKVIDHFYKPEPNKVDKLYVIETKEPLSDEMLSKYLLEVASLACPKLDKATFDLTPHHYDKKYYGAMVIGEYGNQYWLDEKGNIQLDKDKKSHFMMSISIVDDKIESKQNMVQTAIRVGSISVPLTSDPKFRSYIVDVTPDYPLEDTDKCVHIDEEYGSFGGGMM